jgi:hypothetical protein
VGTAAVAARRVLLGTLAVLAGGATGAHAQPPPTAPAPPAAPPAAAEPLTTSQPAAATPPAEPAVPPAAAGTSPAPPASEAPPPPRAEAVGPIPTADEHPAASDHDAVVGHYGVQARRLDPGPLPLALRPGAGCATDMSTPCTVTMGAIGARYWMTRNLAWNGYLAFGSGGGSSGTQGLDTYLGVGPIVGLTVLLGNWRHLAVGASPELSVVWFRPGGSGSGTTTLFDMRAALEAELHFGFVGVPALSVGLIAGAELQYESTPAAHLWSVGMIGAGSVWDSLTDLFIRYYL